MTIPADRNLFLVLWIALRVIIVYVTLVTVGRVFPGFRLRIFYRIHITLEIWWRMHRRLWCFLLLILFLLLEMWITRLLDLLR